MPDPKVLQPSSIEFFKRPLFAKYYTYKTPPPGGFPKRVTVDDAIKSANAAHDRLRIALHDNDVLRKGLAETLELVKAERTWRKGIFWSLMVAIFIMLLDTLVR